MFENVKLIYTIVNMVCHIKNIVAKIRRKGNHNEQFCAMLRISTAIKPYSHARVISLFPCASFSIKSDTMMKKTDVHKKLW